MSSPGPTPAEAEAETQVQPAVTDPGAAAPTAAEQPAPACPRCGTPLREGQDWCLNCGAAATTRIAGPSGWRAPVAIGAAVVAVALAGLVLAFLAVSGDPDEVTRSAETAPGATPAPGAQAPAPAPAPAAPSPAPVPPADPVPTDPASPDASPPADAGDGAADGSVASWPEGVDGWTVVRLSSTSRETAQERADELAASDPEVGILDSDDFSSLRGGFFVVFSGTYDTSEEAEDALAGLSDAGGAYVRRITPG